MAVAIAHLLNQLKDPRKEIKLVRDGLKISMVEAFLTREHLPIKEILEKLDISSSTYFAKKKNHKALDTYTSEKFIRLISVMEMASNILGKVEARNWLYKRIPSLGNESPINILDTEAGHRLVLQTLLQIKHGIYS